MGAAPNYFGQQNIQKNPYSMKTASDAILIRNTILENFEQALLETDPEKISAL
jgi:NADH dehydrogenase